MKKSSTQKHIKRAIAIAGSQAALAKAAGCTQQAISKLLSGESARTSPELAVAIDRATDGKVSRQDLRPDVFDDIAQFSRGNTKEQPIEARP